MVLLFRFGAYTKINCFRLIAEKRLVFVEDVNYVSDGRGVRSSNRSCQKVQFSSRRLESDVSGGWTSCKNVEIGSAPSKKKNHSVY